MNRELALNPNKVVAFLGKPAREFTKADIISYITENEIRMVNFMYPAGDGRLKTLNFVINNAAYLDTILTCGERVDGSSLFPFIEAGSSDLYVVPRFATAFHDPFAEIPTLTMLCSFFNKDGEPLASAPRYTLLKALRAFNEVTGMEFEAMGELEYYVIAPDEGLFPATDQKGYHESAPYAKFNEFRTECMAYIAQAGGQIKYGHSEVGNFTIDGMIYEQNEIEFLPMAAADAADQLVIAKWIIRNLAYRYGFDITFAPKITAGKAGSGLHIHMRIMKEGKNMMLDGGVLSATARKAIAGMMELAPSITAFSNTNPNLILPSCATSGGANEHLLGRPQPLGIGACTTRLDSKERYVSDCQSVGEGSRLRHIAEADRGDALSRWLGRCIRAYRGPRCGVPLRLRAGECPRDCREDIRQRKYPQEGERSEAQRPRTASR